MTEQKFNVGDEVYYCPFEHFASFSIWPGKITSSSDLNYFLFNDGLFDFEAHISELHPTREAAKAALIEKLEHALEEAKKL